MIKRAFVHARPDLARERGSAWRRRFEFFNWSINEGEKRSIFLAGQVVALNGEINATGGRGGVHLVDDVLLSQDRRLVVNEKFGGGSKVLDHHAVDDQRLLGPQVNGERHSTALLAPVP